MPPRFCPKCGAPLQFSAQKFCTICGATVPEMPAAAPAATGPAGIPLLALAAGAIVVLLVAGVLLLPQIMAVAGGTAAGGAGSGDGITPLPPQPGTSQTGVTAISTTGAVITVPTSPPTTIPTTSKTPAPTPTPTPTTTVPTPTPTPRPTSVITESVTRVPAQPSSSSYTSSTPGAPYIDSGALEARIHELTNVQRQNNGLATLSNDPFLSDIARGHSWDMVQQNFFEHENPNGMNARARGDWAGYPCVRVIGRYTYSGISENLYMGHRAESTRTNAEGEIIEYNWRTLEDIAQVTVNGWMASPGHRENILKPHISYEGIGVAFGPDDKVYVTQNFC